MNNPMIDGVKGEMSSGNIFADIGLPDADKLKIGTLFPQDRLFETPF